MSFTFQSLLSTSTKMLAGQTALDESDQNCLPCVIKIKINAKTVGAIIYYDNRPLELEYIKTKVSLDSIIKNKLVSSNFEVATKSILLKDLIKFIKVR